MAMPKDLEKMCLPAVIFFIVVAARVAYRARAWYEFDPEFLTFKVAYLALWTYLVYLACRKGHGDIAWVLAALPFIGGELLRRLFAWYEAKHQKEREQRH